MSGGARELSGLSWPSAPVGALVLVPLGSTEQHGPQLPVATDAIVAEAVARGAAERLERDGRPVLVAPVLGYGASGEHEGFPGTVSIGTEALRLVVVELARSLRRWAGAVAFVNGHGGNAGAVADAVAQLRAEGHRATWTPCAAPGADAHAGRAETSLLLRLRPGLVGEERPVGATEPILELMPRLVAGGVRSVAPEGVLGDATRASAAEGERLLAAMVDRAVERIRAGLAEEERP